MSYYTVNRAGLAYLASQLTDITGTLCAATSPFVLDYAGQIEETLLVNDGRIGAAQCEVPRAVAADNRLHTIRLDVTHLTLRGRR